MSTVSIRYRDLLCYHVTGPLLLAANIARMPSGPAQFVIVAFYTSHAQDHSDRDSFDRIYDGWCHHGTGGGTIRFTVCTISRSDTGVRRLSGSRGLVADSVITEHSYRRGRVHPWTVSVHFSSDSCDNP